jgi:hypothetical protein
MKENIIRMAREVNNGKVRVWEDCHLLYPDELERFAALVADAEREECVRICCEQWLNGGNAMECADSIRTRGQE